MCMLKRAHLRARYNRQVASSRENRALQIQCFDMHLSVIMPKQRCSSCKLRPVATCEHSKRSSPAPCKSESSASNHLKDICPKSAPPSPRRSEATARSKATDTRGSSWDARDCNFGDFTTASNKRPTATTLWSMSTTGANWLTHDFAIALPGPGLTRNMFTSLYSFVTLKLQVLEKCK